MTLPKFRKGRNSILHPAGMYIIISLLQFLVNFLFCH